MDRLRERLRRLKASTRAARRFFREMIASVPAVLAPPRCVACQETLDADAAGGPAPCWCDACAAQVIPLGAPFCLGCKHASTDACRCAAPLPLLSAVQYGESVAALVRDTKYEGWEPLLDLWLAVWCIAVGDGGRPQAPLPELLCPVPTHPARRRERGFAVPERWAARLAAHLGRPSAVALMRCRSTRQQVGLDRRRRADNVRDAFAAGPDAAAVRGRSVALVDDVVTSGATVREGANLLRSLGARRVEVWSFAYEPLD